MVRIKKLNKVGVSHHFLLPLLAILAVGGIGYYMLTLSNAATVPGDPTGVQAKRSYDFINSQGAVIHAEEDLYTDKDDVLSALRYVSIRNVRDNIARESTVRSHLAQNGIKFNYTLPTPGKKNQPLSTKKTLNDASVTKRTTDLLSNPKSGTKYVMAANSQEPYNEYNGKSDVDKNWTTTLESVQKKMWSESNSKIKTVNPDFKVLGPALIGYSVKDTTKALESKKLSPYMDYGNMHSYYGGLAPETSFADNDGEDGFIVSADKLPKSSNNLEERLKLYSARVSGTKPIVVTETGFHDYLDNNDKLHKPTDKRAVGVYMPRVFLENFRIGIVKTYSYQLIDEVHNSKEYEKHFGMFGVGGSKDPKPAAQSMHYMNLRLIDDKTGATTFTPGKLDFTFTSKPDNLRYVLLQKSTGKFYLVAWRAESVYDNKTKTYTPPATPVDAVLNFGRNRTVTADYPNGTDDKGERVVVSKDKKTATIKVSGRATVFEIK